MASTPMMEQYEQIKSNYKDCILFYRLGDFYEMFNEDAKIASKELELTLTGRKSGGGERAPMCGVPFHSADSYISRLVMKGYKVAICEQMEDPSQAKDIVKRDIIKIVTPGTMTDNKVLDDKKNNFLCCVYYSDGEAALVFADISTGEIFAVKLTRPDKQTVINEIASYSPNEIILNKLAKKHFADAVEKRFCVYTEVFEEDRFAYDDAKQSILSTFKAESISSLGLSEQDILVCAVGGVVMHLSDTQKMELDSVLTLSVYEAEQYMGIDLSSRRNLELSETMRDKQKKGSLLGVIDKTKTSMGGRLLNQWLERPLVDEKEIYIRQEGVAELLENVMLRGELSSIFDGIYDITRLINRISLNTANPRDMLSLKQSLKELPRLKEMLFECKSPMLMRQVRDLDTLEDIYLLLEESIDEDAPPNLRDGRVIKKGYNAEVDKLKSAKKDGAFWLDEIQNEEREKTGIKTLKIGFNKVFGYYIEVSKGQVSQVPDYYTRKQTLTNGERYITPRLKEIENTILGAEEKLLRLENYLFELIKKAVFEEIDRLRRTANVIANLDALRSLAEVAEKNNYSRPTVDRSGIIEIVGGRHPVVEKMLKDELFVPNDSLLNEDENRLCIITGPNMAGKSTYMRQVALICIMAQMGSFVPCESARIGIVDNVFTRVGASDDLSTGTSTFMLEMTEVSNILKKATKDSLVIFDEIGRGTSTYDGLSIAWAVAEYILNKKNIGAKTLFATHYHEMTELEKSEEGVKNYRIAVRKNGDDITFLRKIVPGSADRSYGIEVAALAGVPKAVIKRAKQILSELESGDSEAKQSAPEAAYQFDIETYEKEAVLTEELKALDVTTMSPIEALNKLYELSNKAKQQN